MKARTRSEVAARLARVAGLFQLLGNPGCMRIFLELGEGPRDTPALGAAAGCSLRSVGNRLTALRVAGLVESTPARQYRSHALTPTGRVLADLIERLAAD